MTNKELLLSLREYNNDELFYKDFYIENKAGKDFTQYAKEHDLFYDLYIKYLTTDKEGGFLPTVIDDENFFKGQDENNVVITKHNRYTPGFVHEHKLFELIYILEGKCIQRINHEDVVLTKGQFCLVAPGSKHSIQVFDDSLVLNILIRRNTFEEIFYNVIKGSNVISNFFNNTLYTKNQNAYLLIDTNKDDYFKEYVLSMFNEYLAHNMYYENILNGMVIVLFSKLLQKTENTATLSTETKKDNEYFDPILSYIDDNYTTITLAGLAEHFHFSTGYCSRMIKKYTGKTFTELCLSIKFKKAENFLLNTNKSVASISEDVGFNSVEHFNRLFKKRYGVTPGKFRING